MRAWSRAEPGAYRQIELRAHELLASVPLHDVWQVDLPGGGPDRTIADVRALMSFEKLGSINAAVRSLFAIRSFLGRCFRWDTVRSHAIDRTFLDRLSERDREQSSVEPGTSDGPFTVLYAHPFESVSEIRNATVHAFSVVALVPQPGGYALYWAIYVEPVGGITAAYMALIDPFRRFLIYPAVLRHVHRSWQRPSGDAGA